MRSIIKDYIYKIGVSDVINFGLKNNIILSNDEASFLLYHLKNNWEEILYGDSSPIIHKIESYFSKVKSDQILKLFYFYKNKYKSYL